RRAILTGMLTVLYFVIALGYALYLTVAVLLVRAYRRTHENGFIWLGAAVLIWPLVGRALGVVVEHGGLGPFPIIGPTVALVRASQQLFSLVLLLMAVLHLGKTGKPADTSVT